MIRLLREALAAHWRAGPLLVLLTVAGVALGVGSVLAIQILNLNALGAFTGGLQAVGGDADLSVLPAGGALEERLFPAVLGTPGVGAAWPLLRLPVVGPDGTWLDVLGVDLFAPRALPWAGRPLDPAAPLSVPGWVAVSPRLARARGWTEGTRFAVASGSRRIDLVVGALVDFEGQTPTAGSRILVMDLSQAQALFGRPGVIGQVDVSAAAGIPVDRLRESLQARLGPGVLVETPEGRRRETAGILAAFRLNLTALSFISLFVGGFLVYASTQASLVRRRGELGLLRSIGATRGQVTALVLAEVGVLGLLGTALGIPLGYAVARAGVGAVSATLANLYLLREIETLRLPGWIVPLALALGVAGSGIGAIVPALDLARRSTRGLLASLTLHDRVARAAPALAAAGAGLAAVTAAGTLFPALRQARLYGFALAVALVLALPLVAPFLVRAGTRHLPVLRFGPLYGVKSVGVRLGTTAVAVAALAVAVSMLTGITLMVGSFRRTMEVWVGQTIRADVYVTSESWRRARQEAALEPDVLRALAAAEGVRAVDRLRQVPSRSGAERLMISGIELGLAGGERRFAFLAGGSREGEVLVGEPLARRLRLAVGSTLPVATPRGEVPLRVSGIVHDYSPEAGVVLADLALVERLFGPGPVQSAALYLQPGRDVDAAVDALKARLPGRPLLIRSNRALRDEVFAIFDQTFAVTRLLQATSLLIAACGIALTLLVLARERAAEIALYRSLGASGAQVARVYLGQGLGIALYGLVLGTAGGAGFAAILILLVNRAWFGWTIAVHVPWADLGAQALTILAIAALASLYPARVAGRTPATELSRDAL